MGGFGMGSFGGVVFSGAGEVIANPYWGLLAVNSTLSPGVQYLGTRANVTAGQKYSTLVYGGMNTGESQMRAKLRWLNGGGSQVGTDITGAWQTPGALWGHIEDKFEGLTAPGGATQLVVGVETNSLLPGVGMWLNSIYVQSGDRVTTDTPFDGSTQDEGGFTYDWTGTPFSSPSTLSGNYVEDTSPPVFWTFTGQTQKAYRASIFDKLDLRKPLWDTGKVTSGNTTLDTPDNLLKRTDRTYRLVVSIWDDKLREKVGGVPIEVTQTVDFIYSPTSSVTSPTSLVATQQTPWPWVQLNFSRSTHPDSFTILRDNKVIENNLDPGEISMGGTDYWYIDRKVPPRQSFTYRVVANVNRCDSLPSNPSEVITSPGMTWMMNKDLSGPVALVKSASTPGSVIEVTHQTSQEIHQPLAGGNPVLISQFVSGYQGKVEAVIADGIISGLSAKTMIQSYDTWRTNPGVTVLLYMVDRVMEVVPYNMTYRPRAKSGNQVIFDVAFDFYEVV